MAPSADIFVRGFTFDGVTGLKTGANLEDLVTLATPTNGSELVDQVSLETYLDAVLSVYRLRVKALGITNAMLAGSIATSKLADGGVPATTGVLAFRAYNNTTQGVAANVAEKVDLQLETLDAAGVFAVSRFTPTTAGWYHLGGRVEFDALSDGWYSECRLYKNGALASGGGRSFASRNGADTASTVQDLIYLDGVTDYAELWAVHSDTHDVTVNNIKAGTAVTYFYGYLVTV